MLLKIDSVTRAHAPKTDFAANRQLLPYLQSGKQSQTIFFERENYLYFLRLVRQHLTSNGVDVVAYCLMPNHYHFWVYLRDENLSSAMKSLSLSYTKAINQRFNRVGVLFQG